MDSTWLVFEKVPTPQRKTSVWAVHAKAGGALLGSIEWYGAWRQYVFYPEVGCLFNRTCLRDLATFCDEAMAAR